ncbi:hypothetical protein ESA94_20315 [Lacibacter luteus]|uniref:DUF4258 domain-containing protein n=1 Tax=Lacibacter luteus TaxID=2508719 RepID=A0A4Q1CDC5_9BACT|nr:hypothetical protein [Lacibacter luteus]RXK57545.1 hypothetical protein ESA94_20315 [Lacibacter luteus]
MTKVQIHIHITEHAYDRAKERLGWDRKATNRTVMKAYVAGLQHKRLAPKLKRYVDGLFMQKELCNNIRIYGQVVFLFTDNRLITLYQLPNELKPLLKK